MLLDDASPSSFDNMQLSVDLVQGDGLSFFGIPLVNVLVFVLQGGFQFLSDCIMVNFCSKNKYINIHLGFYSLHLGSCHKWL